MQQANLADCRLGSPAGEMNILIGPFNNKRRSVVTWSMQACEAR